MCFCIVNITAWWQKWNLQALCKSTFGKMRLMPPHGCKLRQAFEAAKMLFLKQRYPCFNDLVVPVRSVCLTHFYYRFSHPIIIGYFYKVNRTHSYRAVWPLRAGHYGHLSDLCDIVFNMNFALGLSLFILRGKAEDPSARASLVWAAPCQIQMIPLKSKSLVLFVLANLVSITLSSYQIQYPTVLSVNLLKV